MKKIFTTITIIIIIGVIVYVVIDGEKTNDAGSNTFTSRNTSGASVEEVSKISTYEYTEEYTDQARGFSFKYPKGFDVSVVPTDTNEAIIIQNIETKVGVQIIVSPFEGKDVDVTATMIKSDIPKMQVNEPQELLIGDDRKGLAFVSNNENFGGKSREVWFVYGGNFYQISTYADLDDFLKGIFTTWQFK
ncbi:MAG: PsbP-related protein [Candidatus Paceibacterota bacterium]|jgi:hypothetical protein